MVRWDLRCEWLRGLKHWYCSHAVLLCVLRRCCRSQRCFVTAYLNGGFTVDRWSTAGCSHSFKSREQKKCLAETWKTCIEWVEGGTHTGGQKQTFGVLSCVVFWPLLCTYSDWSISPALFPNVLFCHGLTSTTLAWNSSLIRRGAVT